jgi:polysaccharide pyruvyl transferase WcaK-like protein
MPSPPRIGFWGNFGTRNLGNECTLRAIAHAVRARRPDAVLACYCSEPEDVERRHGIASFPLSRTRGRAAGGPLPVRLARRLGSEVRGWRDALAHARRTDLLVMTGTGMLTDDGEGVMGLPYDLFRWALAARLSGCRVAFASVGVEAIRHPLARFFIRVALRLAGFRSYRDQQSRERLRRAGFFSRRDAVFPDLAFGLPEAAVRRPGAEPRGPRVAVGLYAFRGRGEAGAADAAAYRDYLEKMCALVIRLRQQGRAVRVIIGDNTYDEPVLEDFRRALAERGVDREKEGIQDRPAASFEELMDQLAGVDLVVASRFHNVLLALLLGRPVVSISYNQKNDALMAEMGLGAYCQSIEGFQVERVLAQVASLEGEAARLLPAVAERAARYRTQLEALYDGVLGPLARSPAAG